MRKIPKLMVTQHPDAASKYIPVQEEVNEAVYSLSYKGLNCDEYMVDFEGKATPYHQPSQIVLELIKEGIKVGEEVFITPRIPSASKENIFRQIIAILSAIEAIYLAKNYQENVAIVELIHPMTEDYKELVSTKNRVNDLIRFANKELGLNLDENDINLIPLLETVPSLLNLDEIVGKFIEETNPKYLRVFIGRSDPATMYGMLPSILSCKIAIYKCYELSKRYNIPIYPILGVGALPFRGHLRPENVKNILNEYSGIRTITIQSALRYDFEKRELLEMLNYIRSNIEYLQPLSFSNEEIQEIIDMIGIFTKEYVITLIAISGRIKFISDILPNQRDRLIRAGPYGYSRESPDLISIAKMVSIELLAKQLPKLQMNSIAELPRAIKYTGALYSIGIPPEFIGTGRGLRNVEKILGEESLERLLKKYYRSLKRDLEFAGRFLNLKVASEILPNFAIKQIRNDVEYCMEILDLDLKQDDEYNLILSRLVPYLSNIIREKNFLDIELQLIKELLIRLGKIRKSLG